MVKLNKTNIIIENNLLIDFWGCWEQFSFSEKIVDDRKRISYNRPFRWTSLSLNRQPFWSFTFDTVLTNLYELDRISHFSPSWGCWGVVYLFKRKSPMNCFYLLLGRVKKGGFIHKWVGGWVRKGTKSTKKNMFSKPFFRLENASTDLLIFYFMFTQNMRNFCADLGSFN